MKEKVMKLRIGAERFTTNDKEVCEELDLKFQEVFISEQGEVPKIREKISNQTPLEEFVITSGEVSKHLLDLDVTKGIGPYGISSWILKVGAVYIKSLETGELPKIWKTASVVPIFKKGDKQEALTYRPVSLTCIPCKMM
ncbi:uncharacterized protein [Procambarus clarkii]|uniref:uncharacterized protein n=1 Tax=Procambarus clarkii TaxID=6728 RepID=UPI0037422CE6